MSEKSEGQLKQRLENVITIMDYSWQTNGAKEKAKATTHISEILDEAKADVEPKFVWVEEERGGYVRLFKKDLLEHFAKIEKWFGLPEKP